MTINEKALGYIIVFTLFTIMSRMCFRWLVDIAYKVSGIPMEDIVYQKHLRFLRHAEMPFNKWLVENSTAPEKVKKYLNTYNYTLIPGVFCTLVSVVGLFTHAFDNFMDTASMTVLALNMASALFGTAFAARYK